MLFAFPIYFLRHARFFLPNYLALKYLDLLITTRCSLRCAKCSNLMQHYENPAHIETDFLLGEFYADPLELKTGQDPVELKINVPRAK